MAKTANKHYETIEEEEKNFINDFQAIEGEIIDYGVSESEDEGMSFEHPHSPADISCTSQDPLNKHVSVVINKYPRYYSSYEPQSINKITLAAKNTTAPSDISETSPNVGSQKSKNKTIQKSVNKTPKVRCALKRNLERSKYNALWPRSGPTIDFKNNTGLVGLKIRPKYVADLTMEANDKRNYKKDLSTTELRQLFNNGITIKPIVEKCLANKNIQSDNYIKEKTNNTIIEGIKNKTGEVYQNTKEFKDKKEVSTISTNNNSCSQGNINTASIVAQNDKQMCKLSHMNLNRAALTHDKQSQTDNMQQNMRNKKIRKQRNPKIGKDQKPKLNQQKIKSATCIRKRKKISSTPLNMNPRTMQILKKMNKNQVIDKLKQQPAIIENCARNKTSNTTVTKMMSPKITNDLTAIATSSKVNDDKMQSVADISPNVLRKNCNNKSLTENNIHTSQVPAMVKYESNETIPSKVIKIDDLNACCHNKNIKLTDKTTPITDTAICNLKSNYYNSTSTELEGDNIKQITNIDVISEAPAEATERYQQKNYPIQIMVPNRNSQSPISILDKANYTPVHGTKHSVSNTNNIVVAKTQLQTQHYAPDLQPNIRPNILRAQRPSLPRMRIPRPPFPPLLHMPPPYWNFNPIGGIPPNMHSYPSRYASNNATPLVATNNPTPLHLFEKNNIPMSKETVNDTSGLGGSQFNNLHRTLPRPRAPPPPYTGIHNGNSIIGRNAEGLIKKISLTPPYDLERKQGNCKNPTTPESLKKPDDKLKDTPISTMQEMFDELQKEDTNIGGTATDNTQKMNRQRATDTLKKYRPCPLSKKSQYPSMPPQTRGYSAPHKGYSAPVLPIHPSYNFPPVPHESYEQLVQNKTRNDKSHCAQPENIQRGTKKISLEEYKKRVYCK